MLKNTKVSSLQAIASSALERLQKNKAAIRNSNVIEKPVSDSVEAYDVHNRSSQNAAMLQLSSLSEEYEERLAIVEYDGQQTPTQVERIAYLDTFATVLVTLPYDEGEGDWLLHRITAAKKWFMNQGITQPK